MEYSQSSSVFYIAVAALTILFYLVTLAVYRLYFSPYASFPGPFLARVTGGYAFYYNVIQGGQYMFKIRELHEKYKSPVIRVGPSQLHVIDPSFYDVLCSGPSSKRDKPYTYLRQFGMGDSLSGLVAHDDHRMRRSVYNPHFSPKSVRKLEPIIWEMVSRLLVTFQKCKTNRTVIPAKLAFGALSCDIITQYCFGIDEQYTETPDFKNVVLECIDVVLPAIHFFAYFPWLLYVFFCLPDRVVSIVAGDLLIKLKELKRHCTVNFTEIIGSLESDQDSKHEQHTIFGGMFTLPGVSKARLVDIAWQDAQIILIAGTATTSKTIASALVYLLSDPIRLRHLVLELEEALPNISDAKNFAKLAQLPYLSAVIQESHRVASEYSGPVSRVSPIDTLVVGEWNIPPKLNIGMHQPLIHHSPLVFPEPMAFVPERWLIGAAADRYPRPANIPSGNPKFLVPFSRGTRNCIGQTLANAEIYVTLALFLRTFAHLEKNETGDVVVKGIDLWETDRRDVDIKRDMMDSTPERGRGNIRIILS